MERKDCIFCRIADHDIPSNIVYEDENIIAFKDLNPRAPVHILVIPKKHIESMATITDGDAPLLAEIMLVIQRLARENGIAESGFRVLSNAGRDGLQDIPHLHFHLLGGDKLAGLGFIEAGKWVDR